jgi:hypothetical protein
MPPTLQAFRRQFPNDKNFVLGRVPSLRPNIITEDAGHILAFEADRKITAQPDTENPNVHPASTNAE